MESSTQNETNYTFGTFVANVDKPDENHNNFIANESPQKAINGESFYTNNDNNDSKDHIFESAVEAEAEAEIETDPNQDINNNPNDDKDEDNAMFEDEFFKSGMFREFGSKMKLWTKRETELLKELEESKDPMAKLKAGDKQRLWEIRDKYKTLRRIRTGNTRRLLDQFENWR